MSKVKPLAISVPAVTHIPKAAFEDGIVVVSAQDLDPTETEALRSHILDQLGGNSQNLSLVVINFEAEFIALSEEQMRQAGWVRA